LFHDIINTLLIKINQNGYLCDFKKDVGLIPSGSCSEEQADKLMAIDERVFEILPVELRTKARALIYLEDTELCKVNIKEVAHLLSDDFIIELYEEANCSFGYLPDFVKTDKLKLFFKNIMLGDKSKHGGYNEMHGLVPCALGTEALRLAIIQDDSFALAYKHKDFPFTDDDFNFLFSKKPSAIKRISTILSREQVETIITSQENYLDLLYDSEHLTTDEIINGMQHGSGYKFGDAYKKLSENVIPFELVLKWVSEGKYCISLVRDAIARIDGFNPIDYMIRLKGVGHHQTIANELKKHYSDKQLQNFFDDISDGLTFVEARALLKKLKLSHNSSTKLCECCGQNVPLKD
tara:strand:- start:3937 stop:4986 length:1050 start_codon:yes stop_codon:yes gene_type:complete